MSSYIAVRDNGGYVLVQAMMREGFVVRKAYTAEIDVSLSELVEMDAEEVVPQLVPYASNSHVSAVSNVLRWYKGEKMGDLIKVCPACGSTNVLVPTPTMRTWDCDDCGNNDFEPVTYNEYHGGKQS